MLNLMSYNPLMMFVISLAAAILLGFLIIPALRALKAGQSIRQIGPNWHNSKAGTPTIGGIIFIFAVLIATVIVGLLSGFETFDSRFWAIVICSLLFGIIGFIDDFIKVVLKRNLGLRARHKFILQFVVALGFAVWIVMSGVIDTEILIPFTSRTLDLGFMFIPITVFVMIGGTNSVNLTDGLDGLATSVTILVLLFFAAVAPPDGFYLGVRTFSGARMVSAGLIGGLLGFLLFNKYPAKVFMGDTGSLFLGGAVASVAVLMQMPLFLIIVGFVYMAETLSVIIQVFSFKLTGKRVFKMSPLHHHFEMSGWSERRVVIVFSLVTIILCVIALLWGIPDRFL
ncbi:MAG: phospho-N-acetylmuramoyl-pentapeptide-transferase [Oscillospiraceae bacterium]|nr:phospho-N-acetylmuramoyl-pentapeptide-transferase [Oscillospiraceae bacterium]